MIRWWRTDFGTREADAIANAVLSRHISQGPITLEFEEKLGEILDVPHVVAVSSGSAALTVALMALDVQVGDEVLVPSRSWIATAHAVSLIGAVPVFVDVEIDRPLMRVSTLKKFLTNRTKAIIPVHLNGRAVDMSGILEFAKENNIKVIEDAAQALYSKNYKGFLGTQSDVGCFSLSVAKLISTGQGGFLVTRDQSIAERIRAIRTHGLHDVQDVVRWGRQGFNFRMTDMQAAIGLVQLSRIDEKANRVRRIYKRYEEWLNQIEEVTLVAVDLEAGELPIYNEVLNPNRDQFMTEMYKHGIETRRFFPDMKDADYLTGHSDPDGDARHFALNGLTLPSGPDQLLEDVDFVGDTINKLFVNKS